MFSCLSLAAQYAHGQEGDHQINALSLEDSQFMVDTTTWLQIYGWKYEGDHFQPSGEKRDMWVWRQAATWS